MADKMNNGQLGKTLKEDHPSLSMGFFHKLTTFCELYKLDDYFPIYNEVGKMDKYGNPDIKHFYEAADRLQYKKVSSDKNIAHQCMICNTMYSPKSRGCPSCKAMTQFKNVFSDIPLDNVVELQDNCFNCKRDPFNARGARCGYYGTGRRELWCDDCECIECCQEVIDLRLDERKRWLNPLKEALIEGKKIANGKKEGADGG